MRIIDESGDHYLYPSDYFVPLKLPVAVVRELTAPKPDRRPAPPASAVESGTSHSKSISFRISKVGEIRILADSYLLQSAGLGVNLQLGEGK